MCPFCAYSKQRKVRDESYSTDVTLVREYMALLRTESNGHNSSDTVRMHGEKVEKTKKDRMNSALANL